MNSVVLIGRLTRDPEIRYTTGKPDGCRNIYGSDRQAGKIRTGERKRIFRRVTVFGRQAENCERFLAKGRLVGVQGRIQTGSYTNKDGSYSLYYRCSGRQTSNFSEWRPGQKRKIRAADHVRTSISSRHRSISLIRSSCR